MLILDHIDNGRAPEENTGRNLVREVRCHTTQCTDVGPVHVSGGGISGLCLGVALSRYPHIKVDVYEATSQFKEIGAGVMIWARTWRILELMGLAEDFAKVAHAPPDGSMGTQYNSPCLWKV